MTDTTALPPVLVTDQGLMTAPTVCVACHAVFTDHHLLHWQPHEPPRADGQQRSVCINCFRRHTKQAQQSVAARVQGDVNTEQPDLTLRKLGPDDGVRT